MPGIYLHIPFCNEKCTYCDFFSGNQLYLIDDYVLAICKELIHRKDYLGSQTVNTVYFGGGTPSVLTNKQIDAILSTIYRHFNVGEFVEITLECNPENINDDYVKLLAISGVNRISLGIQFLDDSVLARFNRMHTKELIFSSLNVISRSAFTNLSVDIIYGVPGIDEIFLEQSIRTLLSFDIKHFSAYSLTISKGSKLYWKVQAGEFKEMGEDDTIGQYTLVNDLLKSNGFVQYEISNYCKEGYFSNHNLGYWNQEPYLGAGVSAHSYNVSSRQWNHTNVKKYIRDISENEFDRVYDIEQLTDIQVYNEYIMLKLRTFLGISVDYIENNFGRDIVNHFQTNMNSLMKRGHFKQDKTLIFPTPKDLLLADYLSKILMY